MARFFMLINSCINPFIYASTLPAFKQIVKGYALCKFEVVLEGLREIRTPRMGRKAHDVKNTVSHNNLQSLWSIATNHIMTERLIFYLNISIVIVLRLAFYTLMFAIYYTIES